MNKKANMDDTFVIDKPEQLKALADPLRQRLLSAFCCNPATTRQVADQLEEKATRLYHHVDLLENAGLIRLVETKQNRGTIEKYYLATAQNFVVDHRMLRVQGAGDEPALETQSMIVNMLETALAEARTRFNADATKTHSGRPHMVAVEGRYRFTGPQVKAFIEKMCAWMKEWTDCEADQDGETYLLSAVMFPITDSMSPPIESQAE